MKSISNDLYLSVTANLIETDPENNKLKLLNLTIALQNIPDSHKSKNLAENLVKIFQQWKF